MPIYEYICQDCGTRFDTLRSMKDADKTIKCEHCQSVHTKRALSVFFASSEGKSISHSGGGTSCGSCSGGNCGCCSH